jgi:hypothetical protein
MSEKSAPGSRAFHEKATDGTSTISRHTATIRLRHPLLQLLALIAHHGGRPHEIPPFEPVIVASTGVAPKSRHIALQARINSNNMAQGKGGAAAGGEIGDIREEEHGRDTAEGHSDILRMAIPVTYINGLLTAARNQMRWYQNSSGLYGNDMRADQAAILASSASNP